MTKSVTGKSGKAAGGHSLESTVSPPPSNDIARHGIGGNAPPAFEALSMALDDARDTAADFLDGKGIQTPGEADATGKMVGEVKALRKAVDDARKEEKRPHDEAAKAVQTKWLPLLERADTIIKAAQAPLTAWLLKVEAEQAEQARIAREEAARATQEAIEAQRAAAGNLAATEAAQALQKDADQAVKFAAKAEKQSAHVSGMDRAIGLRTSKVATVTDRRAALNWIARNDPEALAEFVADYARRFAATRPMDGVEVTIERKVA